ncbi:MAG TPA: TetR/AcrR family transcriptional regulator [Stackebrandtia sp.]|jgi:AcrR family transcriptional regulator|uniref:TetR/AcrR family transcriptional regulator n=1 Tax=Stackebrandtia sp. TaxID=2023065 RepID=UPI002D713252|nr:TetR/AcrR family transcriptional regulator [Stackebrandtia sp.]HZE38437.1 TetR/AcrR family transcriptional regulator [Stackebrandtia sp.]
MSQGGFVKTDAREADGRSTRWQAHRQARRDEIVQAAVRAIHKRGSTISMNDIAAEARVSKPVLYRHFADQADLYHAVGQHAARWLVAWLTQHLEPGAEPTDMIATVIDAYLGAVETEPHLYRFVIRYAFADESSPHAVEGFRDIVVRAVEEVLRTRLEARGGDTSACRPWAHGVVGLVQSVGEWWLDQPGATTRQQLTAQLSALIWNGLSQALP